MWGPDDGSALPARPTPAAAGTLGWFGSGNPATGTLPTLVTADLLNSWLGEILSVLAQANIAPSKASVGQLLQAIQVVVQQVGDARYAASASSGAFLKLAGGAMTGALTTAGLNATSGATVPTSAASDNSQNAASTAFVQRAIATLVNGETGALATLQGIAAALNQDSNFAADVLAAIALKAALSGANFTGAISAPGVTSSSGLTVSAGATAMQSFTATSGTVGSFAIGSNIYGPANTFSFTLAPFNDLQSGHLSLWGSGSSSFASNAYLGNDVHGLTVSRSSGVSATQLSVSGTTAVQGLTATTFTASGATSLQGVTATTMTVSGASNFQSGSFTTISTSAAATLASASVTGGLTVGGATSVQGLTAGATSVTTFTASGSATAARLVTTGGAANDLTVAGGGSFGAAVTLPAPPAFVFDSRAARTQDTLNGGADAVLNGWSTPKTWAATDICARGNVMFAAGTWTLPLANSVPAGTKAAFQCQAAPVFATQGNNGVSLPEGGATSAYAPGRGATVVLESDGGTLWYVFREGNLYAPAFRGGAAGQTAARTDSSTLLSTTAHARSIGLAFSAQAGISANTTLTGTANAGQVAPVVTAGVTVTLDKTGMVVGDSFTVYNYSTGNITVSPASGTPFGNISGSYTLLPRQTLQLYWDGGNLNPSIDPRAFGGKIPLIGSGTISNQATLDFTFTAGAYQTVRLEVDSVVASSAVNGNTLYWALLANGAEYPLSGSLSQAISNNTITDGALTLRLADSVFSEGTQSLYTAGTSRTSGAVAGGSPYGFDCGTGALVTGLRLRTNSPNLTSGNFRFRAL